MIYRVLLSVAGHVGLQNQAYECGYRTARSGTSRGMGKYLTALAQLPLHDQRPSQIKQHDLTRLKVALMPMWHTEARRHHVYIELPIAAHDAYIQTALRLGISSHTRPSRALHDRANLSVVLEAIGLGWLAPDASALDRISRKPRVHASLAPRVSLT